MAARIWPTKSVSVTSFALDAKNPRLGRETLSRAPRDIIQYLFDNDKALDVAASIAKHGFFPNEPLLAVKENGKLAVVEGNRRLAALKALREPGLLEGVVGRSVERLAHRIQDPATIASVPVTVAPSRRATDRYIAGRHVGTPVLAWQAANRASFILEKLEEGYDNDELREQLGFSLSDIQEARLTRAIADMARSVDLPDEVKVKLENPRAKIYTTLKRVFDSSAGRDHLKIVPDPDHGLRGTTIKNEFVRGFKRLITDVALGKQSSRTLNKNDDINRYFKSWKPQERPKTRRGSFVPSDVIKGDSVASPARVAQPSTTTKKSKKALRTVLPTDFKVKFGTERLVDIRGELVKLDRVKFANAGAVLLRVFFELSIMDYLERIGELSVIVARLKAKNALQHGAPTMRQLVPEITRLAKERLSGPAAIRVEKAIRYDPAAPFTLSDLHAFVHQNDDLPGERDILQFWLRTEPLFRLMLEDDGETAGP